MTGGNQQRVRNTIQKGEGQIVTGCWCRRVGVKALVDLFVNDCRIKNEVSK